MVNIERITLRRVPRRVAARLFSLALAAVALFALSGCHHAEKAVPAARSETPPIVVDDALLIAGGEELIVFDRHGGMRKPLPEKTDASASKKKGPAIFNPRVDQ